MEIGLKVTIKSFQWKALNGNLFADLGELHA